MTANRNRDLALDDVLAEIASAPTPPDAQMLRAWTVKYPEFAAEIVDFATDWVEMEAAVEAPVTDEDVDLVVNRTMSRVQALLDAGERPAVLADLAADMRAAGYDPEAFQRAIGIDRSILDCLVARLVRPATLPVRLVRALAEALGRSIEAIREYVRLPPQAATAYRARQRPATAQADFAMLVRHSQMSDADKERWLGEPPDPALRE